MTYDMIKYERGQIWKISFKNPDEQKGREQQKDRPWLILSVGKFNTSSGMITAVPITSRDKAVTVAQVLFRNEWGSNNVILCEQIRNFDLKSGNYILEYRGTLSEKVLEKVDVALSLHLGMHYSPITLNSLYDSMEAVIKSIGYLEHGDKFTDEDVERFAEKLKSLAKAESKKIEDTPKEEIPEPIQPTPHRESSNPQVQKFYKRYEKSNAPTSPQAPRPWKEFQKPPLPLSPEESSTKSIPEKAPRMKWTPDKCKEFMEDSKRLPLKEMMEKWHISKPNRYYVMRNYVQNLLLKNQQN